VQSHYDDDGSTPLHSAARNGDCNEIKKLLQNGAPINVITQNEDGFTPLMYVIHGNSKDRYDACQLLLRNGADVNLYSRWEGSTALHLAATLGRSDLVNLLYKSGADLEARTKKTRGRTPLMSAIGWYTPSIETIKLLLDLGAKIEATNDEGVRPLHIAAGWGHPDIMKLLIDRGANTESTDSDSWNMLLYAARGGNEGCVRLALEHIDIEYEENEGKRAINLAAEVGRLANVRLLAQSCADLNHKDNFGVTPVSRAVENCHDEVVKYLVERGVDLNIADQEGRAPLHILAQRDVENDHDAYDELIRLFLSHGADIEIKTTKGHTPLMFAILLSGRVTPTRVLIRNGASLEACNQDGEFPLHLAASMKENGLELAKLLLDAGVPVDIRTRAEGVLNSTTPLFFAETASILQLLIDRGANITARNDGGYTAIHWVVDRDKAEHTSETDKMVRLLIDAGAEVNARTTTDITPLHLAAYNGYFTAVEMLLTHGANPLLVAKSLLVRDKVINLSGTPAEFARREGHQEIADLLDGFSNSLSVT
jgi:ankyrin repeat protein